MSEAEYDVGDVWTFDVRAPAGSVVTVTVTSPADVVVVADTETDGDVLTVTVPLDEPGRFLAVVLVVTDGVPDVSAFTAWAVEPTETGELPGLDEVKEYLNRGGATSATDAQITDALTAEIDAQRKHCDVPAAYPAGLGQALKRRVARNLAARGVPIASRTSFGDGGGTSSWVARTDAEILRFEGPYPRTVVG